MKQFSNERAKREHGKKQKGFSQKDADKILEREETLVQKFLKNADMKKFYEDFKDLFSLIKDYYKGNYKDVPWKVISSIGGTLIYVLSPIDAIPDILPMFGFLDDAAVFAFCLKFIQEDLAKYRAWKYGRNNNMAPANTGIE